MITTKKLKIKITPNTRVYYNTIGYNCSNYEDVEISVLDLPKGSNLLITANCDSCGVEKILKYNKYFKNTKGHTIIFTCKKCSHTKTKKTKLEKYGDENYRNDAKIKQTKLEKYGDENYTNRNKSKQTCLDKYGVDNISKVTSVKNLKKETNIKNWGVDNVFQSDTIKERISKVIMSKYGVDKYIKSVDFENKYKIFCNGMGIDHYSKSDEFKDKFAKTCLLKWGLKTNLLSIETQEKTKITNVSRYGFDHVMKNKDISLLNTKSLIEGRSEYFSELGYEFIDYDYDKQLYTLKKIECDHQFKINYDLFRSRIKYSNSSCQICYPKNELSSIKEVELYNFIKSLSETAISNCRDYIDGKEIDIYLPDHKIGVEFNGLYWHSDIFKDKNYHYNKTKMCQESNISLMHVWEDDWLHRQDIIKSIIKNKLGLVQNKIYGRKCQIEKITNIESNKFLDMNHIQGGTNASICLSLKYNDEIVSVITFGKRRLNGTMNLELIRFCNKIDTSVIGAASKLFKHFIRNYKYDSIISYSDQSIFDGALYKMLGFNNDGETSLNYYWTDLKKRYHRFNFNKKRLIKMGYDPNKTEDEIMKSIGYYKIWSCGQIRWIYK